MLAEQPTPEYTIDCEFLGGNIIVDGIDSDTCYLRQDLRDTEGHWFYWAFRVRGAAGRLLKFRFVEGDVVGVRGPAVSVDEGESYRWLGANAVDGHGFSYHFGDTESSVRFAMAIPYQEGHLKRFLDAVGKPAQVRTSSLCTSEGGREVELLRFGSEDATYRLILTSRHHSCESMGTYALEGLLRAALGSDALGQWFHRNVDVLAVPFIDKDGVEAGDQGKNRRPHDHNRDYGEESIYASVRAFKALTAALDPAEITVALDLHCPYLKGGDTNQEIYFVGGPDGRNWARVQEFCAILEDVQRGPLRYSQSNNLPFGAAWNVGDSGIATSCANWMSSQDSVWFGTSIELPYAEAAGTEVNPRSALAFGRDLARTFQRFVQGKV